MGVEKGEREVVGRLWVLLLLEVVGMWLGRNSEGGECGEVVAVAADRLTGREGPKRDCCC